MVPSRSNCESGGGGYRTFSISSDDGTKYEGTKYIECWTTWEKANSICSTIGGVLPNRETLGAVVTDCGGDFVTEPWDNVEERRDKNIANELYQACYREKGFSSNGYWSATTNASDSSYAWDVGFGYGGDFWASKTVENYFRCVRGGQ